ncbi:ribosome silencing factor [Solimonas sp. K1W22B-7]|uniref:ribosome silencing factor n=1 Tax=Solimonas sp. K1W22B-7 TaxID=2303331 RepID=UPI001968EA4E
MPKPTKLVQIAKNALEDLKGFDIKVLDVAHLTTVTDWMIVCTGTSTRHVKSLADNVADEARASGHRPLGLEGADGSDWVLVDLGSVVVHVMQAQARIHYQLEKLWDIAPPEEPAEAKPKKKAAAKPKTAAKPAAKKPAAKKAPAKKAAVKKSAPAKKAAAKKPAAKKTGAVAKKAPARKPAKR